VKEISSQTIHWGCLGFLVTDEVTELVSSRCLDNIAPTILELMELKAPKEMSKSLIKNNSRERIKIMKFSGKNLLVTGGSRGIGAEIAKSLSKFGLKVWINYHSSENEAKKIQDEIIKEGGEAEIIGFDVSDEKAFIDAIKNIVSTDGELSYLVNNAGITKDKLAMRMKSDEFMAVIEANLKSAFIGCREALKV